MTDYQGISALRKRLQNDIGVFENTLYDMKENGDGTNSIKNYSKRIDDTLALQFQANLIVNISYNIMVRLKSMIKKGGTDIVKNKAAYEEIRECLEHYKNQVFNLSQRLSVLKESIRIKSMTDSD